MSTTNTFLNYAAGLGTYGLIFAAIATRNSGLAQGAITELAISAGLRGIRYGVRRTASQNALAESNHTQSTPAESNHTQNTPAESNHTQNTNSSLDTVA